LETKWLKSRIGNIERKLKKIKVDADLNGLREQLKARPRRLALISLHINAIVDFIERMAMLNKTRLKLVKTEVKNKKGDDIDIIMVIGRETYAFQMKTRNIIKSGTTNMLMKTVNIIMEEYLNDFGTFIRAVISDEDNHIILTDKKIISKVDDYSIAAIYKYIGNNTMHKELKRIRRRLEEASRQFEGVSTDYRIIIYDTRYSPINTSTLINATQQWLIKDGYFQHINGIIYMRLGIEKFSYKLIPYLVPIPNPKSFKPIDTRPYYNGQINDRLLEPRYMFILPIHIYIKEIGWNNLLDIQPGFKVFRNGIYMGSIQPPPFHEILKF